MKLTKEMKELMAFLYSRENMVRYEFSFDKRDNYFAVRIFMNEWTYLTVTFLDNGMCQVYEWSTAKSSYHPSVRCGFLNRYFKKYRNGYARHATCSIDQLLLVLDKIHNIDKVLSDAKDRGTYSPWRGVRRATVRF